MSYTSRPPNRLAVWLSTGLLCSLAFCAAAQAADLGTLPCDGADEGTIQIDGLVGDWEGVGMTWMDTKLLAGPSPNTLRARARCNYDAQNVYLLVEVEDDIVLRSAAAPASEDHIEIAFGVPGKSSGDLSAVRLSVFPAHSGKPRVTRWQGTKVPKVVAGAGPTGQSVPGKGSVFEIFDSLQPKGYAIELAMPKRTIPGFVEGTPLRMGLRVIDRDVPSGGLAAQATLGDGDSPEHLGEVNLGGAARSLAEIATDLKASESDVFFDKQADLGEGPGRVLMIGKSLAFASKGYSFLEVASQRSDIRDVQLVALGGKKHAVAIRVVEQGNGGLREILKLYILKGTTLAVLFATEVGKEQGKQRLHTQVTFAKRGDATDLILTPQPPVGFSPATYPDLPAEDVIPILLPWQDKKTRYTYRGGQFVKESRP
jgi:hypothetical protein